MNERRTDASGWTPERFIAVDWGGIESDYPVAMIFERIPSEEGDVFRRWNSDENVAAPIKLVRKQVIELNKLELEQAWEKAKAKQQRVVNESGKE